MNTLKIGCIRGRNLILQSAGMEIMIDKPIAFVLASYGTQGPSPDPKAKHPVLIRRYKMGQVIIARAMPVWLPMEIGNW
jgi:hypothetical protein